MADSSIQTSKKPNSLWQRAKDEFLETLFFYGNEKSIFYKSLFLSFLIFCSFFCPVFAYIALVAGIIFVIIERRINAIYYIVFLLPFYNVFRYTNEQMFFSIWLLIAFVAVVAVKFFYDLCIKKKKINWIITIAYAVFCGYLMLTKGVFSVSNLLPIMVMLAITYLLFYYFDEINFKSLTLFLFYGIVISAIFSLFINISPRIGEFVFRFSSYEGGFRFQGLSRDPNYYALEVLLCLACFTSLYLHKKINNFYYVVFVILASFGISTCSKSYLISYVIFSVALLGILLFHYIRNKKKETKKCLASIAIVLLCIILPFGICYKSSGFLINRIIHPDYYAVIDWGEENSAGNSGVGDTNIEGETSTDFELTEREASLNSLTTGRSQIWKHYLKKCVLSPRNFLFGVEIEYLGKANEIAIHNTAIQCLYFLGLVGCLLFVALALIYIWQLKGLKQIKLVNLIMPVLIVAIMMCSLDNLFSYRLYIVITLLLYSLFESDTTGLSGNLNIDTTAGEKDENRMLLSIIVPVYNLKNYIEKCVESIINNIGNINYELIIIDDGSTDGSSEILDNLKSKYSSIIVKHKPNGGVSSARNLGIEISSGKYLMFIDGDDMVDASISQVVELLKEENDLVVFNYILDRDGKKRLKKAVEKEQVIEKGTDNFFDFISYNITNGPWDKLFKRDIVVDNNIKFEPFRIAEDMLFVSMYLQYVKAIRLSTIAYYNYIIRPGSAMTAVKIQKVEDQVGACKRALSFCEATSASNEFKNSIKNFIARTAFSTLKLYCRAETKAEKEAIYKMLCENRDLFKQTSSVKTKLLKISISILGLKNTLKLADLVF